MKISGNEVYCSNFNNLSYKQNDIIIKCEHDLKIDEEDDSTFNFLKGFHNFRFSFEIPLDAPKTFEGTYSQINYKCDAFLVISRGFNMKASKVFEVEKCPEYFESLDYDASSYRCVMYNCSAILTMPKLVFKLGEQFLVNAVIVNNSFFDVSSIKISLVRIETITHAVMEAISMKKERKVEVYSEISSKEIKRGRRKMLSKIIKIPKKIISTSGKYSDITEASYLIIFKSTMKQNLNYAYPLKSYLDILVPILIV
jgi:hypothetical protein